MKIFKKSNQDKINVVTYKNILRLIIISLILVSLVIYINPVRIALMYIISIFVPFAIGGVIAFVINIPLSFLEKKVFKKNFKGRRAVTLLLSVIFVIALIVFISILIVPQLIESGISIKNKIPMFIDIVTEKLNSYEFLRPYIGKINNGMKHKEYSEAVNQAIHFLKNGNINPLNNVISAFSSILSIITNSLIAIVFAFYMLSSKEKIQKHLTKYLYSFTPERIAERIYYFIHLLYKNFNGFIKGQFIDVTILGSILCVTMLILKIPYAPMISVVVAFLALIPVVGSFIGCSIGFMFILIDNPTKAVWFIVVFLIIQQIDNNFIYPKIVGNKVGLPAILTLVAIVIGASLGGIIGMWISIPLFSSIYTVIKLYMKYKLDKKNIDIKDKPDYRNIKEI